MSGSTKCFSIEDKGPMCLRRGRDGRVGPPGVIQFDGAPGSHHRTLAIFWEWWVGERKWHHWVWWAGKKEKCSGSSKRLRIRVDRWRHAKRGTSVCPLDMRKRTCARAASSAYSKTPLYAYTRSSLHSRQPEAAASFSGGGFSNYFQVPDYQHTAVYTYIRNLDGLHGGLFKCFRCQRPDLTHSYFVTHAALRVVRTSTLSRRGT